VSEAPGADPQDGAGDVAALGESALPAESPGDVTAAAGQPDAGAPTATAASGEVPDAATVSDGRGRTGAAQGSAPSSADPRVDDALSRLSEIDELPLAEQVQVYADIHRRLAGVLADPDSQA
jgi:hypothetical protein